MHPTQWAERKPGHDAIVMTGDGARLSYGALDAVSNRGARLFRDLGIASGGTVAIWCENRIDYLPVCWAAERAGLSFVPVSTRLTAPEAEYIIRDSGAQALIVSPAIGEQTRALAASLGAETLPRFAIDGALAGFADWADALGGFAPTPIADEAPGRPMLYSSGTTGKPKGIVHASRGGSILDDHPYEAWLRDVYGVTDASVFLTPAPLYHAAPLLFSLTAHRLGATVAVMERFDAEACLAAIERHRVTQTQLVPTMFVRMLRLPEAVRNRYDLSSLRTIIHAGSPCPPDVKRAMIEWLGPIVHEYYGASEGFGRTGIDAHEALAKPGSVGRATLGTIHIADEQGRELGPNEDGIVYFESDAAFGYHGDPEKTRASQHPDHPDWRTFGDIGHVDADGYLFLTDRRAFTIISGGVNIYPQEAENVLAGHPDVADVAVIGVPDAEMGETVLAIVQPAPGAEAGPELAASLIEWCRARLTHYKCPRRVEFDPELPREPTGKLFKKQLRARYAAPQAV